VQRLASPAKACTLQGIAATPAKACSKPLQRIADEPSLNHQEPSDSARKARRSRTCPSSFALTDQLKAWAQEKCPGIDVERETESFRNHEYDKPKSDWDRAWRNWMLNAIKFSAGRKTTKARNTFNDLDYGADV
jgi:hypothetical protein